MPEHLWTEAAVLARSHGLYRISQALRVSYETLRSRVAKTGPPAARRKDDAGAAFVEVPLAGLAAEGSVPVVELSDADGAKLTIRLPAHSSLDIVGLASAWWSRRE
jgi:hypothetical protein